MDTYCAKLVDFEKYLVVNRLVSKDRAKYYVNWADKFLHGINYKTTAINLESFSCFINSMQKNPKYADWQIKQAEGFKIKIFSHKGTEAQR